MTKQIFLLIILFIIISCKNSYNNQGLHNGENIDHKKIAMHHFSNTKLFKKDRAFILYYEELDMDGLKSIIITQYDYLLLRTSFKVGESLNIIPNSYQEIDGKLFVWHEKNKPFNREILAAMERYNKIDSSMYKYEMGLGPIEDVPLVATHDISKKYYYFFCKNNMNKFKAIKSRRFPREVPDLNCN